MKTATLTRSTQSDAGTFGSLVMSDGFQCATAELPWRDNHTGLSRIKPGTYTVVWHNTPSHPLSWAVTNVEGRSGVLIHNGNWAGDKTKGLRCNVEGCILVGKSAKLIMGQMGVDQSMNTLAELAKANSAREPFTLTIVEAFK